MPDTTSQISARELRDQFALYPTGVAVITAAAVDGTRLGMTVSSFNSVSLDPPLVSFNIATSAKSIDQWRQVGAFAVNLLTEDQADLSTRFARALTDKWEGITPAEGTMVDAPLLPGALAWFECETHDMITAGDHLIVLGEVKAMRRSSAGATRPLLFFASRYRSLKDEWSPVPYEEAMWIHGW